MTHNINNLGIKELKEILERQNYKCALTGRPLTPDNCAMDHIVPLSRGGTHTKDNAQLVRTEVNKAKGTLLEMEFIEVCRDVVAYADAKLECNSTGPSGGGLAEGQPRRIL